MRIGLPPKPARRCTETGNSFHYLTIMNNATGEKFENQVYCKDFAQAIWYARKTWSNKQLWTIIPKHK
jgi:hypothetical protein